MNRGLDQGTAFEILSIDIADVDLGETGGCIAVFPGICRQGGCPSSSRNKKSSSSCSGAGKKAKVQEIQAKLVEAESQIPLAMAEAFRSGNLGIMDYYRMRNIEADTEMRESISSEK